MVATKNTWWVLDPDCDGCSNADLLSKVMQVNDPTGTYGFGYDNMGRLTGTSTQYSFLVGTFTNAYSYDAACPHVPQNSSF